TVLTEAKRYEVPVSRVSQGTGVSLLTDKEISDMVSMAAEAGIELCLFIRPCAAWDASATVRADAGGGLAAATRGTDQLVAALDEIRRAADLGVRSVLIGDLGVLSVFGQLRAAGELPADMRAKVSVMLAVANPATAKVVVDLGADTINLPTDLTAAQIAAIRATVDKDRKSTRLNSSHVKISYAVFCLKKKKKRNRKKHATRQRRVDPLCARQANY